MTRIENNHLEYIKRTGAVLTAAGVSFLGGIGLKSAEAMPLAGAHDTAEQLDKTGLKPGHPEGVHTINNQAQIMLENAQAYSKLNERLNVVIVVHRATTKDAVVTFASSPSSYTLYDPTKTAFIYKTQKNAQEVDAPGFEIFKGRPVIAVGPDKHTTSEDPQAHVQWGWGDLNWFVETGAVDIYKYQGVKPGLVDFNPALHPDSIPQMVDHAFIPKTKDIYSAPDASGRNRRVQLMSKQEVQKLLNQLTHRN